MFEGQDEALQALMKDVEAGVDDAMKSVPEEGQQPQAPASQVEGEGEGYDDLEDAAPVAGPLQREADAQQPPEDEEPQEHSEDQPDSQEPSELEALRQQAMGATAKYEAALELLARQQQPQAPAQAPAQQKEEDPYEKFPAMKNRKPEEREVAEQTVMAVLKKFYPELAVKLQKLDYVQSLAENVYLKSERENLEKALDKVTVDRHYNEAARMVATGQVANIEDAIILLDAKDKRKTSAPAQAPRTGAADKQARKAAAAQLPTMQRQPRPASPAQSEPAGEQFKDPRAYLRAVLAKGLGQKRK